MKTERELELEIYKLEKKAEESKEEIINVFKKWIPLFDNENRFSKYILENEKLPIDIISFFLEEKGKHYGLSNMEEICIKFYNAYK